MSASTRSCARSLAAAWLALALASHGALATSSPFLPDEAIRSLPELPLRGTAELRYFGLLVYESTLWSPPSGDPLAPPFVLELHYHRDLDGAQIAKRSVEEIARLGHGSAEQHKRWGDWMRAAFPDVRRGDRLTGVHVPGRGARFFHNGRELADIEDPAFARAFFGIWLDPRTSQPELRRRLLGLR